MRGKPLIKDVSMAELQSLREQGLTNEQIAKKLDVTYRCVVSLLGKQPAGLRKKPERKDKPLPPVGNNPPPEMPRKSFAERLEESFNKAVPVGTVKIPETVREDIERKLENGVAIQQPIRIPADGKPRTLADLARETHERKMAEMNAVGTEERTHIPELIAVFGAEAVVSWLKVSLYDMGIPDCRPMNRQKLLEMLKIMNAGGASV